ncbi:alanine racemase [Xanthobacter agilis]|uniref:Alanine racemase n=1 Tax=Xanthobacter agilis TaxID=47492 RepID=A0ABU0LJL4_XANAG|nr:alanine racemase [Xanthobacter agilis]MDQ0507284.1 alanine racemase [Xanthobacter agilis]
MDLSAIADNWRTLAALSAPAECAAVVKANAYGLGIDKVAPALWRVGARTFFVAHLKEAQQLRGLLPDATIYALNGLLPGTAGLFAASDIRPVLGSAPEIGEWSDYCRDNSVSLPAAIHVDTGMHRLGIALEEAARLSETYRMLGFTPSLIMSHLACADTPGHVLTARQRLVFADVVQRFPRVKASLANSAGTLMGREFRFDLVRPGIFLYGGVAITGVPPLRPVVRLEAKVIQVSTAPAGETVGYGATERLSRDSRLATVHIGYADGFFRAAGSTDARKGAEAVLAGRRCPLVGRISMDLATLDITDLAPDAVMRGDTAVFLGEGITVDELAQKAGTIGYEVLTALGGRYLRRYIGG